MPLMGSDTFSIPNEVRPHGAAGARFEGGRENIEFVSHEGTKG
jgi:hypothetical protein